MQSQPDSLKTEYAAIAESVRSGEYYRKARNMYDLSVHDLMTERYLYILITILSLIIFMVTYGAVRSLYPLSTPVPFIFNINNVVDDIPNIHSLLEHKGEDPSVALLRFFTQNYVTQREEYNIDTFNRDKAGIESQSSPAVVAAFEQAVNPGNPQSPVALYQRVAKRTIDILSFRILDKGDEAEVTYEASVEGRSSDAKKSRWQANIAFQYSGLALDENTGKAQPVSFTVTQYRTKRLQDTR